MGDILNVNFNSMNKKESSENNHTESGSTSVESNDGGLVIPPHRMIVCNNDEKFIIPSNLIFVPYIFNIDFNVVATFHQRAAYLMAYLYEYFTYEDATKLMEDLCDILNKDINDAIKNIDGEFHASFIKPNVVEYTDDEGNVQHFIDNCGVEWPSFNEDFLDFIFDEENGYINTFDFIFNADSRVFNNSIDNLDDNEILDMFNLIGKDGKIIDGYVLI